MSATDINRDWASWVESGRAGVLSIVMPARDEESVIAETVSTLTRTLTEEQIEHELLIVNDGSTDSTADIILQLEAQYPSVCHIDNSPPHGFGLAVRAGLEAFTGDAVAIVMADGSDSPADVVRFSKKLNEGYDCVFGSRFISGGSTEDYPFVKLMLNRIANTFINVLFRLGYDDATNAFKCYRRHVIAGIQPILSHHFNLTVELPLKSAIRGYSFAVLPNSWRNRKAGESKLKIKEMGSRYLFIVLYCLIEKMLSRGDYQAEHNKLAVRDSSETRSTITKA